MDTVLSVIVTLGLLVAFIGWGVPLVISVINLIGAMILALGVAINPKHAEAASSISYILAHLVGIAATIFAGWQLWGAFDAWWGVPLWAILSLLSGSIAHVATVSLSTLVLCILLAPFGRR